MLLSKIYQRTNNTQMWEVTSFWRIVQQKQQFCHQKVNEILVLISPLMHSETSCYFVCVQRNSHLLVCNFYRSFRISNEKNVDCVRLAKILCPLPTNWSFPTQIAGLACRWTWMIASAAPSTWIFQPHSALTYHLTKVKIKYISA